MQTVYILVNSAGILLGVYRERNIADRAIKVYQEEDVTNAPMLYLYQVTSDEVNKFAGNKFQAVWMSNPNKF